MSGYDAYETQYRRHVECDPEEEARREAWEDERGDRLYRESRMDEIKALYDNARSGVSVP
jgi:hypothetical protein